MAKLRLTFVFGTRPEAIKVAPLIRLARADPRFDTRVIVTAQHRRMLDDVLEAFEITPDVDLDLMLPGQSLAQLTARIFERIEQPLADIRPDIGAVQGDTTAAFAAGVAAFYTGARVAHVEAGLRTGDLHAPWPEEANRRMVSVVADWHFAPTPLARGNLLREGIDPARVHVTGNTVIDALLWMAERVKELPCPLPELVPRLDDGRRMVLITGHRRENFGEPFRRICAAFRDLAARHPDAEFIYPVHLNPNVQRPVGELLGGLANFHLVEPLAYPPFIWFMRRAALIITDSGGIQEEAPSLGVPVLVTRRVTERPEAVEAGLVKLVGDDPERIVAEATRLLGDPAAHAAMARGGGNPYGDGHASERILDILAAE